MSLLPINNYAGISHTSLFDEDAQIPWNLTAGISYLDIGKAMSMDTTAPATAKLAVDGDIILGRLMTVENRNIEGVNVGTVAGEGGFTFPIDIVTVGAVPPAIGDSVQGSANPGYVKKLAAAQGRGNFVSSVSPDGLTAVVFFT